MKVYNLTTHPVDFHGRVIPPNGGALDYPELDRFLPTRDKKLEEEKLLSFGFLPTWWQKEHEEHPKPAHQRVTIKVSDASSIHDEITVTTRRSHREERFGKKRLP